MEYCPKCGNKVDETMAFCPRCGSPLKTGTAWQGQTAPPSTPPPYEEYRYRHRHEKQEKNEKAEKHEKPGGSYMGMVIAGIVLLFIGVISYVNATTDLLSAPVTSALVVVIIGLIIVVAGIFYSTRSRNRNPRPT